MSILLEKSDIFVLFISTISYLFLISIQKAILPSNYFSIQEAISTKNLRRIFLSIATRALIIIIIMVIYIRSLRFSSQAVQLGIVFGSFLNVWPSIYIYQLFKVYKSKVRTVYFISCVMSVLLTIAIVRLTNTGLLPLIFDGEIEYFLDNSGVNILWSLVLFVFSPIYLKLIDGKYKEGPDLGQEILIYDMQVTYRRIELIEHIIDEYIDDINQASKESRIPASLLKTVLELEYINRGSWWMRTLEKLLVTYFPSYVIRKDLSIGLAQIKISTASSILDKRPRTFIRSMLKPETSIWLCATHIRNLRIEFLEQEKRENNSRNISYYEKARIYNACFYLASKYICGENEIYNKYTRIYATVLVNNGGFGFLPKREQLNYTEYLSKLQGRRNSIQVKFNYALNLKFDFLFILPWFSRGIRSSRTRQDFHRGY